MADGGEYGRPVRQTDEYGNPVNQTGTMGSYGTRGHSAGYDAHGAPVATGGGAGEHEHRGIGGKLHRSGSSSSSSSSEDDGQGGRRKKNKNKQGIKEKGIKEKIMEKIPGTKEHELASQAAHATPATIPGAGYPTAGTAPYDDHEKKGIMDKIKEKLPGHH
ncbi:hypothetical protein Droror1_Dr00010880 [Drosera rotundifolia]